ncbi:MAG: prepilin-type N-terminal cleavage/methylation domain-containing protein [Candidatus Omnitrophica bacterium]|nr:prepilin-type N-terminal cleavage/methylation domain-containing protein [Candidatus Omnitrophota bacterium]
MRIRKIFNCLRTSQKGFTLIEVMITAVLLSVLLMSFYTVLEMAYVLFRSDNIYQDLNNSAMQSLRYVSREIAQTSPVTNPSHLSITTDGNNNSVVRFQIPVDWDNDADVIQSGTDDVVEWGAYDQVGQLTNGRLGSWIRYSVSNNQLIRDVLDAGLAPIQGLSRVVANNVAIFTATQSSNILTMTLTLRKSDVIGQFGRSRQIQSVFTNQILLRNAVN